MQVVGQRHRVSIQNILQLGLQRLINCYTTAKNKIQLAHSETNHKKQYQYYK